MHTWIFIIMKHLLPIRGFIPVLPFISSFTKTITFSAWTSIIINIFSIFIREIIYCIQSIII